LVFLELFSGGNDFTSRETQKIVILGASDKDARRTSMSRRKQPHIFIIKRYPGTKLERVTQST